MGKKRKTRKDKIILQLKRQLSQQRINLSSFNQKDSKLEISQEEVLNQTEIYSEKPETKKISYNSNFSDSLRLIKKDLWRTLLLSLIIIGFEFVLYLKLK